MKNLLVIDDPKEWKFKIKGAELVSAQDYIADNSQLYSRTARVFNLCRSYRYQSMGYYVSLLASARGQKPFPNVATIQDLKSTSLVRAVSEEIDDLIQKSLMGLRSKEFILSIYFGRNLAKRYDQLANRLFRLFQAPLLRATFMKEGDRWELRSLRPTSSLEIPSRHRVFVEKYARDFFKARSVTFKKKLYSYDLAILVNKEEPFPPSCEKSLKKFVQAANSLGLDAEIITKEDYGRIAEFDGLFIRETTAVNHHTYRFARKAIAEGLVVIDDPESILKCSNKIYLSELLEHHNIRTPKTKIVHPDNVSQLINEIGFPCILKQPDSAFSQGVKKAKNQDELMDLLETFWQKSDLVIAQEFVPTDYDWRIGVIDKTPLFACKYFMAKNHWQILKQTGKTTTDFGRVQTLPIEEVPEGAINIALKAANLIGDGLYGVDLKQLNDDHWSVIEVNDNPNIDSGFEDARLKSELYTTIMKVFRDRISQRKQKGFTK